MRLEQHFETFLSEVVVMRQNLADAALAHDIHRDAVCQAVAFVRPCFVESEAGHECFVVVGHDFRICNRQ